MIKFENKAKTLLELKPVLQKSRIAPLFLLKRSQWQESIHDSILSLKETLHSSPFYIIRSSAIGEDSHEQSLAGKFLSILDVPQEDDTLLISSIFDVFASYDIENPEDIVLIQPMIKNVALSGVIFTRQQENGSDYYTISYDDESNKTDTITSGRNIAKSVHIWRKASEEWIKSPRIKKILSSVHEIEDVCQTNKLDIEFIVDKEGIFWLLQVRPLIISNTKHLYNGKKIKAVIDINVSQFKQMQSPPKNIYGNRTIFSNMSDWNPAEMIGNNASPLSYSLYEEVITQDVWAKARAYMGYKDVSGHNLMTSFAGRPMIDIRLSLNSFLPKETAPETGKILVNTWIESIENKPELHDKIEFSVVTTCQSLRNGQSIQNHYKDILNGDAAQEYEENLLNLTNKCVDLSESSTLIFVKNSAIKLKEIQSNYTVSDLFSLSKESIIQKIRNLLQECVSLGTFPFAIAARHAFIAEDILRTITQSKIITEEQESFIRNKIPTVANDIVTAILDVINGTLKHETFFHEYGHIRPGNYDIVSPRYDNLDGFFDNIPGKIYYPEKDDGIPLNSKELNEINSLFQSCGYTFDSHTFFSYLRESVQMREWIKFVFTRHLSDILELIAHLGKNEGLGREDMSFLDIQSILEGNLASSVIEQKKNQKEEYSRIYMPYLLSSESDFFVIPVQRNKPNFITKKQIIAPVVKISNHMNSKIDLSGKIVCIEQADPGYDWIFACNIAGLVTKYGGSNSHMAIRCSKFSIPAAIGCGEVIYNQISNSSYSDLNCQSEYLNPLLELEMA